MKRPTREPLEGLGGVRWDRERQTPLLGEPDDTAPFDPLDTKNLAVAVAKALLDKKARSLGSLAVFRGAGIYAIYYSGGFPAYRAMARENQERDRPRWPIYIGKTTPGGRRGAFNLEATDTTALFGRLREHAESVGYASNLKIEDFSCRFLVVQDLWIPLAESLLISHFAPIWNRLVVGFGNHDPGSGRYDGACPRWDVLHPGRAWAMRCKPRSETAADIQREIISYLSGAPVPSLGALSGDFSGE